MYCNKHSVHLFISFRAPSTAESIEPPFGFPKSRRGTNPAIASSGNPTESENISNTEQEAVATGPCLALSSPVSEKKNSGSPSGNSADFNVSEKLPVSVPEEGSVRSISEKENAVKGLGTLSYPVTESNHPRTPTENSSEHDTPGRLPYKIPEDKKKTELGESEATCTSRSETKVITYTEVSQNAASSSIEGSVNCNSSERCTPLSGIGKKINHGKASGAPRTAGELQTQRTCRDELKTASASPAMEPSSKPCLLVWVLNTVVQVSTTP